MVPQGSVSGLSKLAQAVVLLTYIQALTLVIERTFSVISSILAGSFQQRTSNYAILHNLWFNYTLISLSFFIILCSLNY
jgi:hypothetical protein